MIRQLLGPPNAPFSRLQGNDSISGDGCTGTASAPVAAPGFVCIYIAASAGTTFGAGYSAVNTSGALATAGDGSTLGFEIEFNGGTNFTAHGTWAYTAP